MNTDHANPTAEASPSKNPTLRLKGLPLGDYQTNAYVAWLEGSRECWLFDAPFDSEEIVQLVQELDLTPTNLLLTHAHLDHIAGVRALRDAFPSIKIAIHRLEADWLLDPMLNLSAFAGRPVTSPRADTLLDDGQELRLTSSQEASSGVSFRVIHVPGHSPGSVAFHAPSAGLCISGDPLFAGSIGRTDFPGCSTEQLLTSIRTRLLTLPPETKLFPGHGGSTTIDRERQSNPYLR
ncbi:MAG: MBL fold metallo-hydrolase [Phycisphaerales bacterium]|nr:MBL fold metallo-hydrolase [Phycisphaerales bacterium]